MESEDWRWTCSKVYFGKRKVVQPAFKVIVEGNDEFFLVCQACAQACFVPEKILPAYGVCGQPFSCCAEEASNKGHGMYLYAERTHPNSSEVLEDSNPFAGIIKSALQQEAQSIPLQAQDQGQMQQMLAKLQSGCKTAAAYEDPAMQAAALRVIPVEELRRNAEERALSEDHALLRELLRWFKSTFRWVNRPSCEHCPEGKGDKMKPVQGMPNAEELSWGAGRVEVYQCDFCHNQTRFPRINHPGKLMETRRGRCGEWANAFTLCCRAMGFEARYILDWTDHVWTEVWSSSWNRWLHADPCENRLDCPLMYEQGWGKKLTYVVGFARNGIADVTRRYTRKYLEVLERRGNGGVPESWLKSQIVMMDAMLCLQRPESAEYQTALAARKLLEEQELNATTEEQFDASKLSEEERQGRISGDAAWKAERGEDGASLKHLPIAVPSSVAAWTPISLRFLLEPNSQDTAMIHVRVLSLDCREPRTPFVLGTPPDHRYAVCVEGIPCARGDDGFNIVVIDQHHGVITHSECFNCGGRVPRTTELLQFLESIPEGHVVIATMVKTQTWRMSDEACQAFVAYGAPEDNKKDSGSWLLVSTKGDVRPPWFLFKSLPDLKGFCAASIRVPVAIDAKDNCWVSRSNQVCGIPNFCYVPLSKENADSTEEEDLKTLIENDSSLIGYSMKDGEPPLVFGADGLPLKNVEGWKSFLYTATHEPGLTNKSVLDEANESWQVLDYMSYAGLCHGDTAHFNLAETMFFSENLAQNAKIREIVVWSGSFVNGVQLIYECNGERISSKKVLGCDGDFEESSFLFEDEESVVEISVQSGNIMDQFSIKTSLGREKSWGGSGGTMTTWKVASDAYFFGLYGGYGGHIHYIGPIMLARCAHQSGSLKQDTVSLSSLADGSFEVHQAISYIFQKNDTQEATVAVQTVWKYAKNIKEAPTDPKFRRIRLSNNFYVKNLGKFRGSGKLLKSLGFQCIIGDDGKLYLSLKLNNYNEGIFLLLEAELTNRGLIYTCV